jgi:hypothetical protein
MFRDDQEEFYRQQLTRFVKIARALHFYRLEETNTPRAPLPNEVDDSIFESDALEHTFVVEDTQIPEQQEREEEEVHDEVPYRQQTAVPYRQQTAELPVETVLQSADQYRGNAPPSAKNHYEFGGNAPPSAKSYTPPSGGTENAFLRMINLKNVPTSKPKSGKPRTSSSSLSTSSGTLNSFLTSSSGGRTSGGRTSAKPPPDGTFRSEEYYASRSTVQPTSESILELNSSGRLFSCRFYMFLNLRCTLLCRETGAKCRWDKETFDKTSGTCCF